MRGRPFASWIVLPAVAAVACIGASVADAGQAPPPSSAVAPPCRPAPHAKYGLSAESPVQVGGGPTYGSARQRRFLDALTGPDGQSVRYSRNVSTMEAPDGTLVDAYEVSYDGLAKPVAIVLDWYHYTEQFAPAGFRCGRDPQLGTPPPDLLLADEQLRALALAIAAAPGFRAGPIDIGEPPEGMIVDRFRMLSRRARPGTPAPSLDGAAKTPGTIVVAFPQTCGGQSTAARSIALLRGPEQVATSAELITERKAVQQLVPGQTVPDGSVAATFAGDALLNGLDVGVSFPDACGPTSSRRWGIVYQGAKLIESPMPARPAADDSGVEWVAVQVIIDHQGEFQQPRALGGPPLLTQAALDALKTWKVAPPRANGAPIAAPVVVRVSFTGTQ